MKKVIMIWFLSFACLLPAKSYLVESESNNDHQKLSLSKKRYAKKVAFCKEDLQGRRDTILMQNPINSKLNEEILKQIKRRFPKKIDLVKSQEPSWPDEYGYNPKKSGRKV